MGWNEWPLMLFTVIAQCAMGAFWWCSFALLAGGLSEDQRSRLERGMLAIWVMMGVAFVFSSAHLGSPLRGINAILRFGQSPLSNEIVFGSAFAGLGFLRWLMVARNIGSQQMRSGVLFLTLACSLGFLWGMSTFYLMPTVPTWNTPLTPTAFVLTALIGGGAVAATLFAFARISEPAILATGPVRLASAALIAAVLVTLAQRAAVPAISSSITHAAELSPDYAPLMALRFLLLFAALGLWLKRSGRGETLAVSTGVFCVALAMLGEMIGRGVFYGLFMTVGLL